MKPSISPIQDDLATLSVEIDDMENGQPIPHKFARCIATTASKSSEGSNISPAIRWSGLTNIAKSYAIIVVDKDVPSNYEAANKPGRVIPADLPRKDFYHWIVVDIPADTTGIAQNTHPVGVIGHNDFGNRSWNENGYDGPCPPWNDERLHHYHFRVFALDVPSLNLKFPFTGKQAENAMSGHVLAYGEVIGTYTLNHKIHK